MAGADHHITRAVFEASSCYDAAIALSKYLPLSSTLVIERSRESALYLRSGEPVSPPESASMVAEELVAPFCVHILSSDNYEGEEWIPFTLLALASRWRDALFNYESLQDNLVRVAGVLFHDARNVMGSIDGICQISGMDELSGADASSPFTQIQGLVSAYDTSSKEKIQLYRGGVPQLSLEQFDLSSEVERLFLKRKRSMDLFSLQTEFEVESGVIGWADPSWFSYLVEELLANAFDSIMEDRSGVLSLFFEKTDGFAELRIYNSEKVIDPKILLFVKSLFITTKDKHNGVGLSKIERYLSLLGGKMVIKSIPGWGTEVVVRHPLDKMCIS